MVLSNLCGPALIYLVFSFIHIIVDASCGEYKEASIKSCITILFTLFTASLCEGNEYCIVDHCVYPIYILYIHGICDSLCIRK